MRKKKFELEKAIEKVKQNTCQNKNQKKTIPDKLISNREEEIKEEPPLKNSVQDNRTKTDKLCKFCNAA